MGAFTMNVAGSCLVLCTVVSLPSSIVELLLLRKSVSMQAASPEKPHNNESIQIQKNQKVQPAKFSTRTAYEANTKFLQL